MIKKNKDGSYNKFQLTIIILIAVVSIFIIGALVIQNIEMPQWNQPADPTVVIKNTTIETVPLINESGKLSWVETETYVKEGGGGGAGSYVVTYNTTYAIGGGGGAGSYTTPSNISNMSYVVVGGGGGSGSINYQANTYINSTQGGSPINTTTQQPTTESNTSQNVTTLSDAIIKIIDIFPITTWVLLVFIFLMIISIPSRSSSGILFPLGFIIILYWFNVLPFNSIIIFIMPAIFIYYIIKMFSSDR